MPASTITLPLPKPDRLIEAYTLSTAPGFPAPERPIESRVAYAAAHVVVDPMADIDPLGEVAVDWEATMAFRRHLWSLGLGVADAMDTAQRGMGVDWPTARDLISRSAAEARAVGGRLACGANTEQLDLPEAPALDLDAVERAYEEQCSHIERAGARVVLMCSRHLARAAGSVEDYVRVYDRILSRRDKPVILHWLGAMFDPALSGYWGASDLDAATETVCNLLARHANRIEGIKLSLLDARREIELRPRLEKPGIRMYTGDDFGFAELIAGDGTNHSDALLGIFDAIAPAASAALQALDAGDTDRFHAILAPTVPLSRHIFGHPTYAYKTGIVFLAYLNGHQDHFRMAGGMESARSIIHLAEIVRLADRAGLFFDAERVAARMRPVLAQAGIDPAV